MRLCFPYTSLIGSNGEVLESAKPDILEKFRGFSKQQTLQIVVTRQSSKPKKNRKVKPLFLHLLTPSKHESDN